MVDRRINFLVFFSALPASTGQINGCAMLTLM